MENVYAKLAWASAAIQTHISTKELLSLVGEGVDETLCLSFLEDKSTFKKSGDSSFEFLNADALQHMLSKHACVEDLAFLQRCQSASIYTITEGKKSIEQLSSSMRINSNTLLDLTRDPAVCSGDWGRALAKITETLSQNVGVSRASIWQYDEVENSIVCVDLYEARTQQHSSGVTLYGRDFPGYFKAIEKEEVIVANNAHTHEYTKEFTEVYLKPLSIYSMLDVPFYMNGKIGGVICFEHQDYFRSWRFDEVMFTISVCSVISVAYQSLLRKRDEQLIQNINQELTTQNEELHQQQEEIIAQRDFIEHKNQEIDAFNKRLLSSINAALVIQDAILPNASVFDPYFDDHFVLFKPRDVVSGDFYWTANVGDKNIVVLADCTGHGVPGAFMTLLSSMLLERVVKEQNETDPAMILKLLDEQIVETLKQKTTGNNYGLDALVMVFTKKAHGQKLAFSSAKLTLLHYKGNSELVEYKGIRRSVGGAQFEEMDNYETICIDLEPGDQLLSSSDGFYDQNDINRKSLGKKKTQEVWASVASLPCKQQKAAFEKVLNAHMEGTTQRDDILLMGIRI